MNKHVPLMFGSILLLMGCSSPTPPPMLPVATVTTPSHHERMDVPVHPDREILIQYTKSLFALDQTAADSFFYVAHHQGRFPSGQVEASYTLQNRWLDNEAWANWKMVFFDEKNRKVDETEWTMTHFYPKSTEELKANSISRHVARYVIVLRTPDGPKFVKPEKGDPTLATPSVMVTQLPPDIPLPPQSGPLIDPPGSSTNGTPNIPPNEGGWHKPENTGEEKSMFGKAVSKVLKQGKKAFAPYLVAYEEEINKVMGSIL